MKEPRPLTEDPSTPVEVRSALAEEKAFVRPFDVDAGLERLGATLEAAPTTTLASTIGLKVVVISLVVGVGALGARWGIGDEEAPPSRRSSSSGAASEVETSAAGVAKRSVSELPPPVVADDVQAASDGRESVSARAPAAVSTTDRSTSRSGAEAEPRSRQRRATEPTSGSPDLDALRLEIALVASARRALESSPERALEVVRRADREVPAGVLLEERRAIEVLALDALERTERARTAANEFLRRYPRSSLADRVREVLE